MGTPLITVRRLRGRSIAAIRVFGYQIPKCCVILVGHTAFDRVVC